MTVRALEKAAIDEALHSFLGGLIRYTLIGATVIATLADMDGRRYIVPNGAIMGGSITNSTGLGKTRGSVGIGVACGSDMTHVAAVLTAAALESPYVLNEEGVGIACVGLGGSSVDFLVHVWSKPAEYLDMMSDVTQRLHNAAAPNNVDIPYPHVVYLTPAS